MSLGVCTPRGNLRGGIGVRGGAQRQGDTSVHFSDPFLFLLYLGCLALINAVLPRINRGQWEASQFRERPLWPRRDSAVNVPGNE